jgi:uncharacterized protein (TIGR02466 family)
MEVSNCFPVSFYSFANPEIVEEIKTKLALEPNGVSHNYPSLNQTFNQELHKDPTWKFLIDWIDNCLHEIQDYEIHDQNFGKIKISRMWANISLGRSGGSHSVHRHPNSLWSGIMYITEGADTKFLDPVYARSLSSIEIPIVNNFDRLTVTPKPGLLVIFPSFVQHFTDAHYGDNIRITISFNTLPEKFTAGFAE